MTTIRSMAKSVRFVVSSNLTAPANCAKHTDYDCCGSIASALRAVDERAKSGAYKEITLIRMRITKGRKPGSRKILCRSNPVSMKLAETIHV